jgi:Ser/Thr protein kinase RdoA (MazF antagonist)
MNGNLRTINLVAREVLRRYPLIYQEDCLIALGNCGGFSGARLWRVEGTAGIYCLRAWPFGEPSRERLSWIHQLQQRARTAGLDFVPAVAATKAGTTWLEYTGRLWDLTTWMPGKADFHERPTTPRLEPACIALARLHNAWRDLPALVGPCPGIGRRLAIAREWMGLIQSGWCPLFGADPSDPVRPWAERAWSLLRGRVGRIPNDLDPWTNRILPLQSCLCDIWHDHVLLDGDKVTGLIDYGGVKVDHVAVDLGRLLGSMIGNDAQQRAAGMQAYARVHPLSWEEEILVGVLDETGTILGIATWLKWLYRDGKAFEDPTTVAQRLAKLVERMENWNPHPGERGGVSPPVTLC